MLENTFASIDLYTRLTVMVVLVVSVSLNVLLIAAVRWGRRSD